MELGHSLCAFHKAYGNICILEERLFCRVFCQDLGALALYQPAVPTQLVFCIAFKAEGRYDGNRRVALERLSPTEVAETV